MTEKRITITDALWGRVHAFLASLGGVDAPTMAANMALVYQILHNAGYSVPGVPAGGKAAVVGSNVHRIAVLTRSDRRDLLLPVIREEEAKGYAIVTCEAAASPARWVGEILPICHKLIIANGADGKEDVTITSAIRQAMDHNIPVERRRVDHQRSPYATPAVFVPATPAVFVPATPAVPVLPPQPPKLPAIPDEWPDHLRDLVKTLDALRQHWASADRAERKGMWSQVLRRTRELNLRALLDDNVLITQQLCPECRTRIESVKVIPPNVFSTNTTTKYTFSPCGHVHASTMKTETWGPVRYRARNAE